MKISPLSLTLSTFFESAALRMGDFLLHDARRDGPLPSTTALAHDVSDELAMVAGTLVQGRNDNIDFLLRWLLASAVSRGPCLRYQCCEVASIGAAAPLLLVPLIDTAGARSERLQCRCNVSSANANLFAGGPLSVIQA